MTTLCPAVQERVNKKATSTEEIEYMSGMNLGATLQAEWMQKTIDGLQDIFNKEIESVEKNSISRERVKKAIDKINYYSYDGEDENSNPKLHKILAGFLEDSYIRTEDFFAFLKKLGIEQEEKEK